MYATRKGTRGKGKASRIASSRKRDDQRVYSVDPISADNARTADLVSIWERTAARFTNSRFRILLCRDIRRNEAGVSIDPTWCDGNEDVADWLEVALPDRQLLDVNLTNALATSVPKYTRAPRGSTQTDTDDADALELWGNSAIEQSVDWPTPRGLAIQEGEYGVLVLPDTAAMADVPEYMQRISTEKHAKLKDTKGWEKDEDGDGWHRPNPAYERDAKGRAPDHPQYTKRSEKASSKAHNDDYIDWLANHLPWTVQFISALDCVPILVRGKKRPWECNGLLRRTLFDEEELLARKFKWEGMGQRELIPRSFDSDSTYGQGGQIYLYEAYLMLPATDGGPPHPTIVYSVGGAATTLGRSMSDGTESEEASVIDLYEEYGIETKLWEYYWGCHLQDDPDFRGMPYIWPMVPAITNLEGLLTADLAGAWKNSFGGHIVVPDQNVPPAAYMEGEGAKAQMRTFKAPKMGEVKLAPGLVTPFQQAMVGQGARYMEGVLERSIRSGSPDPATMGGEMGDSGRQMVVAKELMVQGKSQIRQAILDTAEFVAECVLRIATAIMRRDGVPVAVYVNDERIVDGETKRQMSAVELKDRWVGTNYRLFAEFPPEANLAEVEEEASLYERGLATFDDVQKKRGNPSPMTTRVKREAEEYWKTDAGKLELMLVAAQYRGDAKRAADLEMQLDGLLQPDGTPTAALAPELQGMPQLTPGSPEGQPLQGPAPTPGPTQLPDFAASSRAGQIAAGMQTGAIQGDANVLAAAPNGVPAGV
jgi:hypothetical protein